MKRILSARYIPLVLPVLSMTMSSVYLLLINLYRCLSIVLFALFHTFRLNGTVFPLFDLTINLWDVLDQFIRKTSQRVYFVVYTIYLAVVWKRNFDAPL